MDIEIKSNELLTEEQLSEHFTVYSGPGSGKTHFIVNNIKNIITMNSVITSSNERKVLCITYTNSAVDEIKKRLNKYVLLVEISTIHKFVIDNIIIPFQNELKKVIKNDFKIDIERDDKITSQTEGLNILYGCKNEKINEYIKEKIGSTVSYDKKELSQVEIDIKTYLDDNSIHKFTNPKGINNKHLPYIKKYIWEIVGKLTHNEVLYFGYRMLQENPIITYVLRVKYPFVFVDEFQDTNPLQTLIINHLGNKSTIIGVVGDVAQSIYSFQGARPSHFIKFKVESNIRTKKYNILDNYRSTNNIVNFCNYLRSSDNLEQTSIRVCNENDEENPIYFICGDSKNTIEKINSLVNNGGVVLTRTWADTFNYIQDIEGTQRDILKKIYYNYNSSIIDIRRDIIEYNKVMWVRAFKFIILLNHFNQKGLLEYVINAFSLYHKKTNLNYILTAKNIFKIKELLNEVFEKLVEDSLITDRIDKFNSIFSKKKYNDLRKDLFGTNNFNIEYASNFDFKIIEQIKKLTWNTSLKLFEEVFSKNSKYMTVHQAKGLEWDKVIVAVSPKNFDKIKLIDMFNSPSILDENSSDEFTRMYYVACSRAKKSLYILIPDEEKLKETIKNKIDSYVEIKNCSLKYEFIC